MHGDDAGLARTAIGVGSNALALASLLCLLAGLALLAQRPSLRAAPGRVLLAGAGTGLVAGGAWTQLVLLPVLAVEAPVVAREGAGLLTAGYVVSFLVAGLGWLLVGLELRADLTARRLHVRLLLVGAVLMVPPLPARWILVAVAVAVAVSLLVSTREADLVAERTYAPVRA